MKADNLLNDFYDKVAQQLCDEVCCDNCKHKNQCHFDTVTKRSDKDDVNTLFFSMLDDVEKIINKTADNGAVTSYSEYYKDTAVINWDKLLDKIKAKLVECVAACNGEDNSRARMIAKAKKLLLAKVSPVSVASVYYYKKNHRIYNKSLEQAYREIVKVLCNNGSIFNNSVSRKVSSVTLDITAAAITEAYDTIYNKSTLEEKYKPHIDDFLEQRLNDSRMLCFESLPKLSNRKQWYQGTEYYNEVVNEEVEIGFLSWDSNYKQYIADNEQWSMSRNTYLALVNVHIPKLIGASASMVKDVLSEAKDGKYVIENISIIFNGYVNDCYLLFKKNSYRYNYESRFQLVQSMDDLLTLSNVIDTYMQVIAARVSQEEYNEFVDAICNSNSNAIKEIKIIQAAADVYENI